MKRATILALLVLLAWPTGAALAQEPPEPEEITTKAGERILVRKGLRGTAPTMDEIMVNYPVAPEGFGAPPRAIINPSVSEPLMSDRRRLQKGRVTDEAARPFLEALVPATILSFGGYDSSDNVNQGLGALFPPDTEGDVGVDFYVQYNNVGWKMFNKSNGSLAAGPFPGNSFWQGSTLPPTSPCVTDNAGDPIVLYDHVAGKWVFSQFVSPTTNSEGHQCFAVTQGSNPLGPYFVYDFVIGPPAPNGEFNDYEKIGVWTDASGSQSAYHMTSNQFNLPALNTFLGVRVTAFERTAMLAGAPAQSIEFFRSVGTPSAAGHVPFALQPSHLEGPVPPAGRCNLYMQLNDNGFTGVTGTEPDGFQFWEYCVDFQTPGNSTFIEGPQILSAPFNIPQFAVPQPVGPFLDILVGRALYRFNTRMIGGTLRGVIAHDVELAGNQQSVRFVTFSLPSLAGVSITDQGSLAPPDTQSRWMPSAGLDSVGNVAVVYSRSGAGAGEFPSVYYTGRETTDPPGTLQTEAVCVNGSGVQTGTQNGLGRWGDYASVSMDPVDNCTFWMTNEYVETTGSVDWDTQICSFRFASCDQQVQCQVDEDCDNGLFCDGDEVCNAGLCEDGTPPDCDDGVSCTVDACNEGTDSCDNTPNDLVCDNGLFCDGAETCDPVNDCQPGSNPCAAGETCDEVNDVCVADCQVDADCDNGLFCDGAEVCNAGVCEDGTPPDCDDGVSCTVDACNEGTDSCDNTPNDALCDNGLFCDGAETCDAVNDCQPGTAPNCDDGVACTVDSCNEGSDSCDNAPNDALCDNGLFCDGAETCDAALGCQPGTNPCPGGNCDEVGDVCPNVGNVIWMSFRSNTAVPGVGTVADEDIVAFDEGTGLWSLVFDGSDVGLGSLEISGMTVNAAGNLLLSFTQPGTVGGFSVDDSDIVEFAPTSLGSTTSGTFSFFFDGSDVGLTTNGEDIDSITLRGTQLVISTTGTINANGVSAGRDEDLFAFTGTFGTSTTGNFSQVFDGSDVALNNSGGEDVDAASLTPTGTLLFSTQGNFSVSGLSGADEDVSEFTGTFGTSTAGTFAARLDLSALGISTSEDVGSVRIVP